MKIRNGIACYIILVYALTCFSCNGSRHEEPVKGPAWLLSDFKFFWKYWNEEVKLSRDFLAYDENEKVIGKGIFLEKLLSGEYLPLRLKSTGPLNYYKLYKINNQANDDISSTIKICAGILFQNHKLVNKPLPGFSFIDLNGNLYNKETCKEKIVVLNFWFIHCTSCVAEMPVLNEMVNSYKNRDDIIFVSLALDSQTELKAFLEKKAFNYAIVPDMQHYLSDTLKIPAYPTHVIINKKGLVVNVPEDYNELAIELRKEALK